MGLGSHGVPLDASVEGTQKPADEEVAGWLVGYHDGCQGRIEGRAGQIEERRGFGQTHPWACLVLIKEIWIMGMDRADASS